MVNLTPSLKEVREALAPFKTFFDALLKAEPDAADVLNRGVVLADVDEEEFIRYGDLRRAAALYDSLLTAQAEANVSEIRSWDAPGFEVCVKAERERLAQMEDRAGDYKAQAVIDPKPKSLLEMVEEQSARPVPPFGYHPLPDDAAASPSPSALTESGWRNADATAFDGKVTEFDDGNPPPFPASATLAGITMWFRKRHEAEYALAFAERVLASAISPKGGT